MKTLLIDNYDSFTFNLYHLIAAVNGEAPVVVRNDERRWEELDLAAFDNIVVGPGPGHPSRAVDLGISAAALRQTALPTLGICLGHQGIAQLFGGRVEPAPTPVHGHAAWVHHAGEDLFRGLPSPFSVIRYHSLAVAEALPPELIVQARSEDGVIMALRHRDRPLWGVQFHPESICSQQGRELFANFRELTREASAARSKKISFPTVGASSAVPGESPMRPAGGPLATTRPLRRFVRHVRRLAEAVDAEALFLNAFAASPQAFWLDSSRLMPGRSRYSILGDGRGPHAEILAYSAGTQRLTIERQGVTTLHRQSIFDHLEQALRHTQVVDAESMDAPLPCDFQGGYVGYLGYELGAECLPLKVPSFSARDSLPQTDARWIFADRFVVIDHVDAATYLVELRDREEAFTGEWMAGIEAIVARGARAPGLQTAAEPEPIRLRLRQPRESYLRQIQQCLEKIRQGESYELCLTNTLELDRRPDSLTVYRWLRHLNPAPYAAYLRFPGLSVLSSSPECFLKVDPRGRLEARPIKGTAPRGENPEADARLRDELAASAKNRAENLMIVDLLRHDLGRVAELGSVEVSRLMEIESYASVHQMVSTIRAQLRRDRGPIDAIRAAFPGGSMTGAPKRRSMEILQGLERAPRGVYSGALGFVSLNGAVDLSIVIRTIVASDTGLRIGAGGAIVASSDPEAEYEEMLLKARVPLEAIRQALVRSRRPGASALAPF